MWAVCGAALAASCQLVLGLGAVGAPGSGARDAAAPDTAEIPGAPPLCNAPQLRDDFTGQLACAPGGYAWGAMGSIVSQDQGVVSIQPPPFAMQSAGCTTNESFGVGSGGVIVQLVQALDGSDAYTGLQLLGPGVTIGVENGTLLFADLGLKVIQYAVPYSSAMQWIRIVPLDATGRFAGEYWDGMQWVQLGTISASSVAGQIVLDTSLYDSTTFQGSAQFAHLRVCP